MSTRNVVVPVDPARTRERCPRRSLQSSRAVRPERVGAPSSARRSRSFSTWPLLCTRAGAGLGLPVPARSGALLSASTGVRMWRFSEVVEHCVRRDSHGQRALRSSPFALSRWVACSFLLTASTSSSISTELPTSGKPPVSLRAQSSTWSEPPELISEGWRSKRCSRLARLLSGTPRRSCRADGWAYAGLTVNEPSELFHRAQHRQQHEELHPRSPEPRSGFSQSVDTA